MPGNLILNFKLKINIKPTLNSKNTKHNYIYIKYIIYYLLLVDFIFNNKHNYSVNFRKASFDGDSEDKPNKAIKVKINSLKQDQFSCKLCKSYIIKKVRRITILYSPNRHKKAQKHIKFNFYIVNFSIQLFFNNLLGIKGKTKLIPKIIEINKDSSFLYLILNIKLILAISIINISIFRIKLIKSNSLTL